MGRDCAGSSSEVGFFAALFEVVMHEGILWAVWSASADGLFCIFGALGGVISPMMGVVSFACSDLGFRVWFGAC